MRQYVTQGTEVDILQRDNDRKLANLTMAVYVLQAVSFFAGVTPLIALIGLIINYIKRSEVKNTLYESHFNWQIRTFWVALLVGMLGYATLMVLVGFAILFVLFVWCVYRVWKGVLYLNDGRPMPA